MPYTAIRWGTQGNPVPGNTIRIVNPDTHTEMPVGEVGEIRISSHIGCWCLIYKR